MTENFIKSTFGGVVREYGYLCQVTPHRLNEDNRIKSPNCNGETILPALEPFS